MEIEIEKNSYRGDILRAIVQHVIKENLYNLNRTFKEHLRMTIEENVKFKVIIGDLIVKDDFTVGEVHFENHLGGYSVITYTISNNLETFTT